MLLTINKAFRFNLIILVVLISQNTVADNRLGRLFFSAPERKEISKLHQQALNAPQKKSDPQEQELIPDSITLNGLIIRSQGNNTVWIDEQENPHQQGLYGLQVNVDHLSLNQVEVPILIHSGDIQVYLKPGQTMDTTNGWVMENYIDSSP